MNNAEQTTETKRPLWVIAQSKDNPNRKQKAANAATRKHYFAVLEEMKQLYKEKIPELAFERDYKTHPGDKPNSIYCFLTEGLYWHLCCEDDYTFVIRFNTGDFQFTSAFNRLWVYREKAVRAELTTDTPVATMFERSRHQHDDQFFTFL